MSLFLPTRRHLLLGSDGYLLNEPWNGSAVNLGRWTVTDTGGRVSVSSGRLRFSGGSAWGDPLVLGRKAFARQAGLTFEFETTPNVNNATCQVGVHTGAPSDSLNAHGFHFDTDGTISLARTTGLQKTSVPYTGGTSYRQRIVLKATGALYYWSTDAGVTWSLIGTEDAHTGSPLYPYFLSVDAGQAPTHDFVRVRQQSIINTSSLLTDLVAFWRMEEASGTRVDATSRGNDLTDNNTVTQAAGKIGNAGQFTAANSEYLSRADNADLSAGDIDFTIAAWAYLDTKTANRPIVFKYTTSLATSEYGLLYLQSADRFRFGVTDGATEANINADVLGSPSTGTWYCLIAWHDSVADTINIQVNDGVVNSAAWTNGSQDTATAFAIGAYPTATQYMDGRIDAVGFWRKVLTAAERTEFYNTGNGVEWPFS